MRNASFGDMHGETLVAVFYKSPSRVPQECSARVSHKSVLPECPVCHKTVLQDTRVPHKSAHKSVLQECPTTVFDKSVPVTYKSIPQECPARVSHKNVRQECERPTRVFRKGVPRVTYKSVPQECPARVSYQNFLQGDQIRVSYKRVLK